MREAYPGVPVIAYVNTTAAVKAEVDICCTSGNAQPDRPIRFGGQRVIMLPDQYLARNVAAETGNRRSSPGPANARCMSASPPPMCAQLRDDHPGVTVLVHPECPPEVVAEADFAGSTAAMSDYVDRKRPGRVVLLTECSMSDNVAVRYPELDFIRPCNLCPHMKRITLARTSAVRWRRSAMS